MVLMITTLRRRIGKIAATAIISLIALVFVFFGVYTPDGNMVGMTAGTVNGDPVSLKDFNRAYEQRIQFFKSMNLSEDQLKQFRIHESVFRELATRKLMSQEAERLDLQPGDEAVRDAIREIPAFQKDGKFSPSLYRQVLQANNFTPGTFERMVREDLLVDAMQGYLRDRVKVADQEVRMEYLLSREKRNIRYVLITPEAVRKQVRVPAKEVAAFLADEKKRNLAKARFDAGAKTRFKGKTFDQAKEEIAREVLSGERSDEVKKLTDQWVRQLTAEMAGAKDASLNAKLKALGVQVKTTGMINRRGTMVAGIGEAPEMMKDAFEGDLARTPKSYRVASGVVVAQVVGSESAEPTRMTDSDRVQLLREIRMRKENEFYRAFVDGLMEEAEVKMNPQLTG